MEKKLLVKYTDVQICREELTILKHINFELYSGEFVYFIGRVGSGKSSLLKTICLFMKERQLCLISMFVTSKIKRYPI